MGHESSLPYPKERITVPVLSMCHRSTSIRYLYLRLDLPSGRFPSVYPVDIVPMSVGSVTFVT
jgi:hypothetical protein